MRADKEDCKAAADAIYEKLLAAGVEVIYDDRKVSAGVMFADADLLGVPVRINVGPKNLAEGKVELRTRDKRLSEIISLEEVLPKTQRLIQTLFEELK